MQLQELKKALDQCRLNLSRYDSLMKTREAKMQTLVNLKQNVESQLLKKHILKDKKSLENQKLEQSILDESAEITKLKLSVKEIDHELDLIGEEREETFQKLKQELITQIDKEMPEIAPNYHQLEAEHKTLKKTVQKSKKNFELFASFFNLVEAGSKIELKNSFLSYLLGSHPKARLAHLIHKAAKHAQALQPQINDQRISHLLTLFIQEAEKSWNPKLYRGKFQELYQDSVKLKKELQHELVSQERSLLKKEEEIELWLERHIPSSTTKST